MSRFASQYRNIETSIDQFDADNAKELEALREERKREGWTVATCEVRSNSPHPRSYGASMKLPLTTNRFTKSDLLRITPAERKALAARPLKVARVESVDHIAAAVIAEHSKYSKIERRDTSGCNAFHMLALRINADITERLETRAQFLQTPGVNVQVSPATVASDVASASEPVVLAPLSHDKPKRVQCMRCNDSKRMRVRITRKDGETFEQFDDCDTCTAPRVIGKAKTVAAPKVAKTPRAKVAPIAKQTNNKSDKDALRRAFIAWLKGRAMMSKDGKRYMVKHATTGKTKVAPWSGVVLSLYPDVQEFHRAAHAWQSPRNAATLANH